MSRFRKCDKIEFYSAIRKDEITWFEGKWIQMKDIMFREVSQAQKDKGHMCSFTCGK
jgi:hypothetical protein